MKKFLPLVIAASFAALAIVAPARTQSVWSNDKFLTPPGAILHPVTPAQKEEAAEWQRTVHLHELKIRADGYCRVTADLRILNPAGGMWASKGELIAATADNGAYESQTTPNAGKDFEHLVKDCHLARMLQFVGNSRARMAEAAASTPMGSTARPALTCNTFKNISGSQTTCY